MFIHKSSQANVSVLLATRAVKLMFLDHVMQGVNSLSSFEPTSHCSSVVMDLSDFDFSTCGDLALHLIYRYLAIF